jgi:hypothetical protein
VLSIDYSPEITGCENNLTDPKMCWAKKGSGMHKTAKEPLLCLIEKGVFYKSGGMAVFPLSILFPSDCSLLAAFWEEYTVG